MKAAIILSGCGHLDGAEIRESILSFLVLEKKDIAYDVYAPDINQHHVVSHLNQNEVSETRNVLTESTRITRGHSLDLKKLNPSQYDLLVLPGGFGVAKNLSSLATSGEEKAFALEVFKETVRSFHKDKKPIVAICISPTVLTLILDKITVTAGKDEWAKGEIKKNGSTCIESIPLEIVTDLSNKIISTPAYMFDDAKLCDVEIGIEKAINKAVELI